MIKRVVEVATAQTSLTTQNNQLRIDQGGMNKAVIPLEDLGILILDGGDIQLDSNLLSKMAQNQTSMVVCDSRHLPIALFLPWIHHGNLYARLELQIHLTKPFRKRLWAHLVQCKIRNQAKVLGVVPVAEGLIAMADRVQSGDPENLEAQAAKIYWKHWLGERKFQRDPEGDPPNGLLNYGYALIRACLAKSLVAHGFLPALGVHHRGRSNAFNLADDLIEPLRPLVDRKVRELVRQGTDDLAPQSKKDLLSLLWMDAKLEEETGPLAVVIHKWIGRFGRCLENNQTKLPMIEWR